MPPEARSIEPAPGVCRVHDIPGRVRLRLPDWVAGEEAAERVLSLPGVQRATWTPRTRGLLVLYGPEISADDVAGAACGEAGGRGPVGVLAKTSAVPAGGPTLAGAVIGAARELDGRLRRASREAVGLGSLVPAALAVWAIRELMLGRVAPLGWSTALWYAHGLFRDYSLPPE